MLASLFQSIAYIILISQLCHSQQCRTNKRDLCIFPFEYQNKVYTGCIPDEKPWCSTSVDEEGIHIKGRRGITWGECSTDCPLDGDSTCEGNRQCINLDQCSEYNEFKQMPKTNSNYKHEINKWRTRICNKKQKKLCCSTTTTTITTTTTTKIPLLTKLAAPIQTTEPVNKTKNKKSEPFIITEKPATTPTTEPITETGTNVCKGGQVYGGKYLPTLGQCGKFCATGRIHGGVNAGLGEFPWAALLGYTIRKRIQEYPSQEWVIKKRTKFRCGGTLINNRYVLTAAHCHSNRNKITSVVLGEWEVGKDPDCPQGKRDGSACLPRRQKIRVESVTVHENYRKDKTSGEVVNDIALVRLKKHVVLNEAVQPICLPLNEKIVTAEIGIDNLNDGIVGRNSTIVGWGTTENFGTSKNSDCQGVSQCILQKVDIPIISNDECQSEVTKLSQNSTIRSSHICAVSRNEKDKDSCKGDSGGGMFISKDDRDKTEGDDTFYQVGIVSYGLSRFCGIGYPGVYTRISEFIPWIEENLLD